MSFQQVLTEAVQDFELHGYDDPQRLADWMRRLHEAAELEMPTPLEVERKMKEALDAIYKRGMSNVGLERRHPGVARFTIDQVQPEMRAELTARIIASADLIKLNRQQAIEKTLQRFSGWATSIPAGGSRAVEKRKVKVSIGKPLKQLSYEERRVAIDQGHKLLASIDAVIADASGAIAMMWRSHWRQAGYDYRPDHKERDKKVYAIRGNWAMQRGLMNKGDGYTDELTAPAEEPFCRCYGVYLHNLRDLPAEMLTAKGKRVLEETSIKGTNHASS